MFHRGNESGGREVFSDVCLNPVVGCLVFREEGLELDFGVEAVESVEKYGGGLGGFCGVF